ncbi:MAG: di-trans,poly-cis-decaprenylcistransferase [Rickettsiales bacterium]|jgi:undecaprenyl diphosphate synthase|nr:di-trans,poly-cis-decaprenylcistransferase [Rickettsiales bacterium]
MSSRKLVISTLITVFLLLVVVGTWVSVKKTGHGWDSMRSGGNFPESIAIIMDGNGRWAKKRNLDVNHGHKKGAETLEKILEHARKAGVKSLTFYTFSTENWGRSEEEVGYILALVSFYLDNYLDRLAENNVRLKIIGDLERLDQGTRKKIHDLEEKTANNNGLSLNIAFSYGGRAEIVNAAKNIALDVKSGKLQVGDIDEELFKRYLYNPDIVYPDLVIRTGSYLRISNFLLWEISYSELYFTDVLWPDFDEKCFDLAIEEFKNRKRTYGRR